jgi:hypothetical protein
MRKWNICFLGELVATALLILSGVAMPAPAKEETDLFAEHRHARRSF